LLDPKNRSSSPSTYRIYVPSSLPAYLQYYQTLAEQLSPKLKLEICPLPSATEITGKFVKSLNDKPGILALAMEREGEERLEKEEKEEGKRLGLLKGIEGEGEGSGELKGIPFVVPGARFNELYNVSSRKLRD
jgi:alpha,alpha-trehalase